MEKIAQGRGQETDITQGEPSAILGLRPRPSVIFSILHKR